MFDDRKWLVIGVSGVTCGGKTTLTQMLDQYLNRFYNYQELHKRIAIGCTHLIHQDEYFLAPDDPRHQRIVELNHNNWELPTALDAERMLGDIRTCLGGAENLFRPSQPPAKIDVLIIEGFVIFNEPAVLQLCHLKFHLHLPFEKCYERRRLRTYDPPDVIGYFERCVWPMYLRHYDEFKDCEDVVVLNGELPTQRTCDYVLGAMRKLLATSVYASE